MQTIMNLQRRGFLTEQQVLHAHKFSVAPNSYSLAPIFHRVLYDVIIKEEPLEALEKKRGWPARSAKAIVSMILFSMQEINGSQMISEDEDEVTLREQVEYLTADNTAEVMPIIKAFKMTVLEARLFLILKRSPGMQASKDSLLNRLYAEQIDDAPEVKIIDVFVCKMRKKLKGTNWKIETIWGVGYKLTGDGEVQAQPVKVPKSVNDNVEATQRNVYWYKLHVYEGMPMREIARNNGVAPSTVMRIIHKLMDRFGDEELDKLVSEVPADYTAQKERATT
ncbi:CzcR-like response regulator [Roseobacter phage RDJL3]|nr:CzcR-like response regulator [Roseobacter phage RDJL3]